MKGLIIEFNQVGVCKINVDLVLKKWNDSFFINRYHDEYALVKKGNKSMRIEISKQQGEEIIDILELIPVKNGCLRHGFRYMKQSAIIREHEHIKKIYTDKELDILYLKIV